MLPWCDPQTVELAYAVGDVVYSGANPEPGTVIAVDHYNRTISVEWSDGIGGITYPIDAPYLRKRMPWDR